MKTAEFKYLLLKLLLIRKTVISSSPNNNDYRLKLILENTWHVKAEIWSKCQQAVEEKYNKPENS